MGFQGLTSIRFQAVGRVPAVGSVVAAVGFPLRDKKTQTNSTTIATAVIHSPRRMARFRLRLRLWIVRFVICGTHYSFSAAARMLSPANRYTVHSSMATAPMER